MTELLDPYRETVILGGLGSDEACVQQAAANLQSVTSNTVYGVTSYQARKYSHQFRELLHGRNVVPYSGGATIVSNIITDTDFRPETINFVAPPDRLSRYAALHGFALAAVARTSDTDSCERASTQVLRFVKEVGGHPETYFRLIHEARRFEQLAAAVAIKACGVERVNLIVPQSDEIFSAYELPLSDQPSSAEGVRYIVVKGGHNRFTNETAQVFEEAQVAPFAIITDQILGEEIPERLRHQPTLSMALAASRDALRSRVDGWRRPIAA